MDQPIRSSHIKSSPLGLPSKIFPIISHHIAGQKICPEPFAVLSHPPQISVQKDASCISNYAKRCAPRDGNHFGSPKVLAVSLVCEAWIVSPRYRMYGMLQYPLGEM
jgi:hypothetical protein